jgi:ketosteroid isomerase-like protein/catechol 2,3-dioxygenase-like lactoylglutathione lyase family enzyme
MVTGEQGMSNEDEIRALIETWARAVSAGDRKGILAHHSPDLVMFDFPNEINGLDAYEKTWDFFFANPSGKIVFAPEQIDVTAGDDVAFAVCLFHCDGTSGGALDFRLTTGLRRQGDEWVIVHEHHSVRTIEERFTGSATHRSNSILADAQGATRLPAKDLERARRFYAERLGLEPVEERPGGLRYRCGTGYFALFESTGASSGNHTQMGWEVANIESTVAALRARGVVFEEYDLPGLKTVNGIAEIEGNYPSKGVGERAAWFRDSEGNLLGLGQPVRR